MYSSMTKQAAIISLWLLLFPCLHSQTFKAEEADKGIKVYEDGHPVLFFNTTLNSQDGAYSRAHYVHPLFGLDGVALTEDFPKDHPHQRGVYWAWVQVHIGSQRIGDLWHTKNIVAEVEDAFAMETAVGNMEIYSIANWKSPNWNEGAPFVQDSAVITIHPRKADYYIVDFDIFLTGLTDSVLIGGTESEKEYSGFITRLKIPDDIVFLSSNGEVRAQNAAVQAGSWMEFSGDFSKETKGIVLMAHPDNPGPNNKWVLRTKGSMQNAVYPGWHLVPVPQNNPLNLRYRLVVHNGNLDKNAIENLAKTFGN